MYNKLTNNTISRHRAIGKWCCARTFVRSTITSTREYRHLWHIQRVAARWRWNRCRQVMVSKVEWNRPQGRTKRKKAHYRELMQKLATHFNGGWWLPDGRTKWISPTNYGISVECMACGMRATHKPIRGVFIQFLPGLESRVQFAKHGSYVVFGLSAEERNKSYE